MPKPSSANSRRLVYVLLSFIALSGAGIAGYQLGHTRGSAAPEVKDELPPQQPEQAFAHEVLNATLWQQTSGEYAAVTRQIYALAERRLDEALADKTWSAAVEQHGDFADLPPAIMLDLDETVLDNSCYEARIITTLGQYTPASFDDWCRESRAAAVPGVGPFLQRAADKGVAIFYSSGRTTAVEKATAENLRNLRLPLRPGVDGLLLSDGSSLEERRTRLAKQNRILLLLGDNLNDFVGGTQLKPAERRALAERYQARWGKQWIILPNPIYGHWEAAFYDFDYRAPRPQILRQKRASLDRCDGSK